MKKIIAFLITAIIIIGNCSPTFAKDMISADNVIGGYEIEIPISSDSEVSTYAVQVGTGNVSVNLIRSGKTKTVQVYLAWSGNFAINGFRFKKLTVKSTSALSPTTYGSVGNGSSYSTYKVTGSKVATQFVKNISVPTSVTKVKVTVSSLQVYAMVKSSWISGAVVSKTMTIR